MSGLVTIAAAIAIAGLPSRRLEHPGTMVALLSLVVLACGVLASHAVSRIEDRAFLVSSTAVHQCAAAIWIGGLPQLWLGIRASYCARQSRIARRFSRFALLSVLAFFGSGIAMALRYIDSPAALYGTSYRLMLAGEPLFFSVFLSP